MFKPPKGLAICELQTASPFVLFGRENRRPVSLTAVSSQLIECTIGQMNEISLAFLYKLLAV
jgi:hypothetical protein